MRNAGAADALRRRKRRQALEGCDELGTTIGISRVIERIHADEDVRGAERLGPGQRQRQEDGVAGGYVGRGDTAGIDRAILRNRRIGRQRGPAERRQVHVELEVPLDAKRRRHSARRLELARVALPVAEGQREQPETLRARNRRGRIRVQAAAQEDNGVCMVIDDS